MRISCEQQLTILGHKTEIPPLHSNFVKDSPPNAQSIRDLDSPCYVPDVPLLPAAISPHVHRCQLQLQRDYSSDSEQPEMCDNECQTKRRWQEECDIKSESEVNGYSGESSEVGFGYGYNVR